MSALGCELPLDGMGANVRFGPFVSTSTSLVKAHLGIAKDHWQVAEFPKVKYA